MPRNEVAKTLIALSRVPVVAPSANVSGKAPARTAKEILKNMGNQIDLIIDGGDTEIGVESTIVDTTCFPYKIVREGAIPASEIADIWNNIY